MGKVTIHNGPYTAISENASPGLQFLKQFLPALDSLDPSRTVAPFLTPNASIIVGSQPANPGNRVIPLLEVRSKHLDRFRHDVHVVWDIEHTNADQNQAIQGDTRRTVMFEATSVTVFKNDPDQFEIKVKEFNVLELVSSPSSGQEDNGGLLAREIRTYMDARPVQDQAARLHSQSTYAESKAQY
ncbi:hypothetical protein PHISP_00096 [Aspergillus sp. HF37]|nr:hypothetical protein PHISP_00096 [Aspergillus sp. HF37]